MIQISKMHHHDRWSGTGDFVVLNDCHLNERAIGIMFTTALVGYSLLLLVTVLILLLGHA